jgi:hypothetical protein
MGRAHDDPRLGPVHQSLYLAILYIREQQQAAGPVLVSARRLMPLAKIRALGPYHRAIRQLHSYGYLRYEPSYDGRFPSRVWLDRDF